MVAFRSRLGGVLLAVGALCCGCHAIFPYDVRRIDAALGDGAQTDSATDVVAGEGWGGDGEPVPGPTFNASTSKGNSDYVDTLTFDHTVGAGANGLLLVGVVIRSDSERVTSATFSGAALTLLGTDIATDVRTEVYYLKAPSPGTHPVVVNISATRMMAAGAMSFSGVDQTAPFGPVATDNGDAAPPSVQVSSAAGELIVDFVGHRDPDDPKVLTAGPGQTEQLRSESTNTTEHDNVRLAGSTKAGAPSTTMSWSLTPVGRWALVAVSLRPAS